jgi:hypothetical protein
VKSVPQRQQRRSHEPSRATVAESSAQRYAAELKRRIAIKQAQYDYELYITQPVVGCDLADLPGMPPGYVDALQSTRPNNIIVVLRARSRN